MDRFEQRCRENGLKFTPARRVVLEVIEQATDHPDAFEIYRRVGRQHRLTLSTIYRTLNTFAEVGVVVRHDFGDGRGRYEGVRHERHDHLVDVESGKILEFDEAAIGSLVKAVAARLGYRLLDYRLELFAERGLSSP
ncbi:MAG: transcriptional repressor [Proteobacteria bacterium]|nr:transcriptional repressor [Pseudomonadota bacterium]